VIGRQKHYQANPHASIFDELCGIASKTMGLAEPLRQALAPLAPRMRAAFVYGSVAKRQDTASSDIDLMIGSSAVVVTKDEDFARRRALTPIGPAIVWIRSGNMRRAALLKRLAALFPQILAALTHGERLVEVR
jgi:predicted nuclease of predicted toxin-antitoxin system